MSFSLIRLATEDLGLGHGLINARVAVVAVNHVCLQKSVIVHRLRAAGVRRAIGWRGAWRGCAWCPWARVAPWARYFRHAGHCRWGVSRFVPALVRDADGFRECPDVVVSEAQSLDFGELGVIREGRQHTPQSVQRIVQVVHPVPFAVVGLQPAVLLYHVNGGLAPAPAPALLLLLLQLAGVLCAVPWRCKRRRGWGRGRGGVHATAGILIIRVRKGKVTAGAVQIRERAVHCAAHRSLSVD